MAMAGGGNSLPSASCGDDKKRRVCYYYDPGISTVDYGDGHVMVPYRVTMAHDLVAAYGLLGDMRRLRTAPATEAEIAEVHDGGYVALLRGLTPDGYLRDDGGVRDRAFRCGIGVAGRHGEGADNPVFDRLWDGFCYVNDIVIAIRELLGHFRRVLYVDIDVHHGDGVEKAFEASNRVMTVSFHQYGDKFFPRSGNVADVGTKPGEYCTLNVPLKPGIGDDEYHRLFEPIMARVMEVFQPEAVVLQCGADSLAGDRLGDLSLTLHGHARCVSFIRSFNLPLLLGGGGFGGGGYTINHVASCWCNETAVAIGKDIPNDIPEHGTDRFYENQRYQLHYTMSTSRKNCNTARSIDEMRQKALENLSKLRLEAAAGVPFEERGGRSTDADALYERSDEEEEERPSQRLHRLCFLERADRRRRREPHPHGEVPSQAQAHDTERRSRKLRKAK
uniref:Histone deacetylase n=1 Tax=Oryza brachyantha TaxID=4533 RepID=J3L1E9_ORYBR